MKKSKEDYVVDFLIYAGIILYSLSILYPVFYTVMNSLNARISTGTVLGFPQQWTFDYYQAVLTDSGIIGSFFVSVLRTVVGTFGTVMICSLAAYALKNKQLRNRRAYLLILMIPTLFSGGMIPTYLNLKSLHMLDTFWVYIFPKTISFFYIVVLMSSFSQIPDELEEAARIDGASAYRIFFQIVLPVSVPVLATIALFAAVDQWNSWFDTAYYTVSKELGTLSSLMMKIINASQVQLLDPAVLKQIESTAMHQNAEGIKLATMIVSILPITAVYPFLQKYFIKGIMLGSIKG